MMDEGNFFEASDDPPGWISKEGFHAGFCPAGPEHELVDDETWLRRFTLMEIGDGLSVSDRHGVVVFVNDNLCRMIGRSRDELLGRSAGEFLLPAQGDALETPTVCPQCGGFHQEAMLRRKDDSLLEIALDRRQLADSTGQDYGTIDVVMDVTGKARLEQSFRDNAAWQHLIVENLNDIFWAAEIENVERAGSSGQIHDRHEPDLMDLMRRWRFTYVSSSFERLFGYPYTQASQLNPFEVVPASSHEEIERELFIAIQQALNDPQGVSIPNKLVLPFVTATGPPRWCETSARVLYDDAKKRLRFVGVTRDVTESRLAEEAVCAREEKFRAICDAAQDAVIVMDADGKAVHWNPAAQRMFGYRVDEVLGRDVHSLLTPRRLHEKIRRGIDEFRRSGQGPVVGNVIQSVAVRKNGEEFPVEIAVSPLVVDDRHVAVGTVRDITERTLAEEAVREEQRRLARLLDVYESHRKMATYEIHDRVTQPLVSALMTLEGFSRARGDCSKASWIDFDNAVAILRETLAETRRFMSGMRPHVLDELGVVTALDHLVREHRISGKSTIDYCCDVSFQRLAPPLETTIFRIVQEGLVNAQRHSRAERIRVELLEHEGRVRILVQDWGIGFNLAEVSQDHFGLEGIRQRAAVMGGSAVIDSSPGEGTRIQIDLPLVPESSSA